MESVFLKHDHFDITSLFNLPDSTYLCENCCGIIRISSADLVAAEDDFLFIPCPVCKVEYMFKNTNEFKNYLRTKGLKIDFSTEQELINQCKSLASIAILIKSNIYLPITGLFQTLLQAKKFIHITSYGISHVFIGALKLVAQRIPVRCVISGVESNNTIEELTTYANEAHKLKVKIFDKNKPSTVIPHQKIVIIDGLMAFKGSTNLTLSGWRKTEQKLDLLEVVTDIKEVVKLNNEYFSPLWADPSKEVIYEVIY